DRGQHVNVGVGQRLPEVRDLADLPQEAHAGGIACPCPDVRAAGEDAETAIVERIPDLDEAVRRRLGIEALGEVVEAAEIELGSAPAQPAQRRKMMRLDRLDDTLVEGAAAIGGAERAIGHMPAGATGDL